MRWILLCWPAVLSAGCAPVQPGGTPSFGSHIGADAGDYVVGLDGLGLTEVKSDYELQAQLTRECGGLPPAAGVTGPIGAARVSHYCQHTDHPIYRLRIVKHCPGNVVISMDIDLWQKDGSWLRPSERVYCHCDNAGAAPRGSATLRGAPVCLSGGGGARRGTPHGGSPSGSDPSGSRRSDDQASGDQASGDQASGDQETSPFADDFDTAGSMAADRGDQRDSDEHSGAAGSDQGSDDSGWSGWSSSDSRDPGDDSSNRDDGAGDGFELPG